MRDEMARVQIGCELRNSGRGEPWLKFEYGGDGGSGLIRYVGGDDCIFKIEIMNDAETLHASGIRTWIELINPIFPGYNDVLSVFHAEEESVAILRA